MGLQAQGCHVVSSLWLSEAQPIYKSCFNQEPSLSAFLSTRDSHQNDDREELKDNTRQRLCFLVVLYSCPQSIQFRARP